MGSRSDTGFTLTEMLVVVSLITLSLMIMMPPIYRARQRARNEAAVTNFVASHELARQVAMRYGRVSVFQIKKNQGVWSVAVDTTFQGTGVTTVQSGIFKGQITTNRAILCFDGRGLPTTRDTCEEPDVTVTFTAGDWSKTLKYSPIGSLED